MFLHLRYTLSRSNMFWNERGNRGSLATNVRGPWQRKDCFNLFVVKRKEGKKKGEKFNMKKQNISKLPSLDIFKKYNEHIHFLVQWSLLLVYIWFTPSEGPKGFKNVFVCLFACLLLFFSKY